MPPFGFSTIFCPHCNIQANSMNSWPVLKLSIKSRDQAVAWRAAAKKEKQGGVKIDILRLRVCINFDQIGIHFEHEYDSGNILLEAFQHLKCTPASKASCLFAAFFD